ncbi:MAG: hypothetical protein ACREMP_11180 [Candidatus Tyrphobacter sp.]
MKDGLEFDVVGAAGPRAYFDLLTLASIAHAYVFSGPSGVGKKTFARRLAQSLLCTVRKDGVLGYDGTCRACALFAAGARHPDFHEHEGTLKIGDREGAARLDDDELSARDVVRRLSMESYSGGARVLLLGDLDFATHHAANALLKFLEEPPRGVLLLVTVTSAARLLPTIRSRALEVRFPLLSREDLFTVLTRKGYDEALARRGASLGQGSVSRALAALGDETASIRPSVARWFFEIAAGGTPQESWAAQETLDVGLEIVKGLVRDWAATQHAASPPLFADYEKELRTLPPLTPRAFEAIATGIASAQHLGQTNVSASWAAETVRMALTEAALG